MVVGPFKEFALPDGGNAPLYLLRYAADGRLLSPQTEAQLRQRAANATDVFIFSHGWNNVFKTALDRYVDFTTGYMKMRADLGLPVPRPYDPVLVGIVWPSTGFVLPWENGPDIAAVDPAETEGMFRFVADSLAGEAAADLAELVDGGAGLTEDEAARAAQIVGTALAAPDPDGGTARPSMASILDAWRAIDDLGRPAAPADPEDFGAFDAGPAAAGAPGVAGIGLFDPRNMLRMGTVWKMKDRAGTVGANGVGPLVRHLRDHSQARLHLIGHSFGARLLLSAIASAPTDRKVRSMLLLQAAVNRWCFTAQLPSGPGSGGYHDVLAQVEQPVLATLSARDRPLHDIFHLVMRSSLGEPDIAAIGNTDLYGALGGYGPAGLGAAAATAPVAAPGSRYPDLDTDREVVAIEGTATISGHGDISNPSTWWALHCLTAVR